MMKSVTIVIPAYNDAMGLESFLPELLASTEKHGWKVIVVNDCSPDNTRDVLKSFAGRIRVVENSVNRGYGGSLKRGILAAETEWVATMDADGQHRICDLENMVAQLSEDVDALIGERGGDSHVPFIRMPGKWVLGHVANFITGRKIPDINCGLRVLRRDVMLNLFQITSDRFSFSTSTLVALLQLDCNVRFVPVTVTERIGTSSVKQVRDGLYTIMLILRLVTLFSPLRIFLPISVVLFGLTAFNQLYVFFNYGFDITTATVVGGLGSLIIFCVALLADQISGVRRELLFKDIIIKQMTCKGK